MVPILPNIYAQNQTDQTHVSFQILYTFSYRVPCKMYSKLTTPIVLTGYTLNCPVGCHARCTVGFQVIFELSGKVKTCSVFTRHMLDSSAICHVGVTRDHFTSYRKLHFYPCDAMHCLFRAMLNLCISSLACDLLQLCI